MNSLDEAAQRYDHARSVGRRVLQERWRRLGPATEAGRVHSGHYASDGLAFDPPRDGDSNGDAEQLEYAVGVLKLSHEARIPHRSEKDAPIPWEALTDEVPAACQTILYVPGWHDPGLLRLALAGLVAHQEAHALVSAGPSTPRGTMWGLYVAALINASFALAAPFAFAAGLGAVMRQSTGAAGLYFCVVGLGALAALNFDKWTGTEFETAAGRTHAAWVSFRLNFLGPLIGAGARFQLERMAQEGVAVPADAFDLCAALQARVLGLESPRR